MSDKTQQPKKKKRSPKAPAPTAATPTVTTPTNPPPAPAAATASDPTRQDVRFLSDVLRFLVNVQQSTLAPVAAANGYDATEHAEGLRLYRTAMGDGLPLPVVFGLAAPVASTSAPTITPEIRRIDAFENLWFPRTRAIIRRVVPEAGRERFEASFFHELAQQPLGPGVVGSVRTWIFRVEALEASAEPGAPEVLAALRKRGLTPAAVAEMKALVESQTAFVAPVAPAVPSPAETSLAEARAERQRALASLRAWYNDWSTTLRSAYDRRQLLQLGLIAPKPRAKDADADDDAPKPDA